MLLFAYLCATISADCADNQEITMSPIQIIPSELSEKDCFHIVDRHKRQFTYPLHCHNTMELNFVHRGNGVRRTVGDSVETIGELDLVMIGSGKLGHVWEQGDCTAPDVREITIHFSADIFSGVLDKNQFESVREMFKMSQLGIAFDFQAILKVYSLLDALTEEQNSFEQFLFFEKLIYLLSKSQYRVLSSTASISRQSPLPDSRSNLVKQYLEDHFTEDISLTELAQKVNMSPSALSRYFKQSFGENLSTYLIGLRLEKASRILVDTTDHVADVARACGFQNLSNFNRMFKLRKGLTPKDFRARYKKNKHIV